VGVSVGLIADYIDSLLDLHQSSLVNFNRLLMLTVLVSAVLELHLFRCHSSRFAGLALPSMELLELFA